MNHPELVHQSTQHAHLLYYGIAAILWSIALWVFAKALKTFKDLFI